ncbi:MAG: hypothetical protein A2284_18975 [Deltaproteobacteria bacterium RIFOXYA12_FULL_61_11]|nr:MAG: hypothetical protein A2284_18975 [Deltaproteobacteria bacterium RIFOXYA12_FULL_61_11]
MTMVPGSPAHRSRASLLAVILVCSWAKASGAAPSLRVDTPRPNPVEGRAFTLELTVDGLGFDEVVRPPKPALPEGLTLLGVSAAALGGQAGVRYTLRFEAVRAGQYRLDDLAVTVVRPSGEERLVAQALTLEVQPFTILGLPPAWLAGVGAGGMLVLALGLGLFHRGRRKRAETSREARAATDRSAETATLLDGLSLARSGGDYLAFYRSLTRLLELHPVLQQELDRRHLEDTIEAVGYGGHLPPPEEPADLQRRVEVLLRRGENANTL